MGVKLLENALGIAWVCSTYCTGVALAPYISIEDPEHPGATLRPDYYH